MDILIEEESRKGNSAVAPDGKSFRFVRACDARLVYLMSDRKEIPMLSFVVCFSRHLSLFSMGSVL